MLKLLGLALLSGLLLSAGFPTYGFPFFLFLGFVPLFFIDDLSIEIFKTKRKTKLLGFIYLAFFLWIVISVWWLNRAKHPDGSYAWEALLFVSFCYTLFMTLVFILYSWVKKNTGDYIGSFFFIALWISSEKFNLEWEFSFPWLNLGNAFAEYYKWIQWYEHTGTLGGTLWILTINFVIYHGIKEYQKRKQEKFIYRSLIISFFLISIPISISYYIYQSYQEKGEKINVTIIQPAIDSYTEKYQKSTTEILNDLLDLTHKNTTKETDFVVFPETAFTGIGYIFINDLTNDLSIIQIKKFLDNYPKTSVISGISLNKKYNLTDEIPDSALEMNNEFYGFHNSAIQINQVDSIQYYHKSKLVPGVEIFPYIKYLKPLFGDIMLNFGGTVVSLGTQKDRTPFVNSNNAAIVAPSICYEAIYGEFTGKFFKNNANVLFMMSNDSWWENSDGHRQLFHFSRLRAIETRKSIVRSANAGISAIINQRGDVVKSLGYEKKGAIQGEVRLNNEKTNYVLYGDYISRFSFFIAGILLAFALSQNFLSKKR